MCDGVGTGTEREGGLTVRENISRQGASRLTEEG